MSKTCLEWLRWGENDRFYQTVHVYLMQNSCEVIEVKINHEVTSATSFILRYAQFQTQHLRKFCTVPGQKTSVSSGGKPRAKATLKNPRPQHMSDNSGLGPKHMPQEILPYTEGQFCCVFPQQVSGHSALYPGSTQS